MASTLLCHANLGDTMEQCIARYGQRMPPSGVSDPAKTGAVAAVFQQDGYHFEVYLLNGIVECEMITKADYSLIADKDAEKIVLKESTDGNWAKSVTARGQVISMKADGAVIFYPAKNTLMIMAMSSHYVHLASEAKKSAQSFPSEHEVKEYIVVGMAVEDVVKKFGQPDIRMPAGKNEECLTYGLPSSSMTEASFAYGGFDVFVKNGKVSDLTISHYSRHVSPPAK